MTPELQAMMAFRLGAPVEVKFAGGAGRDGLVTGYASAFGGPPDSYGHVIARGCFEKSLAEHRAAGTMPAMLWGHDPQAPIGQWIDLKEDRQGLIATGQLNLQTDRGREAYTHLSAGDVTGLSIGGVITAGATTITEFDLMEVSVVAIPANRRARITSVKHLASRHELELLLQDAGLPRGAATKLAAGGWPALTAQDHSEIERFAARMEAGFRDLIRLAKGT